MLTNEQLMKDMTYMERIDMINMIEDAAKKCKPYRQIWDYEIKEDMTLSFGKYKGIHITSITDIGYLKWLKNQSFIKQKYKLIYNYLLNLNFS
jgi:hypothetical protein